MIYCTGLGLFSIAQRVASLLFCFPNRQSFFSLIDDVEEVRHAARSRALQGGSSSVFKYWLARSQHITSSQPLTAPSSTKKTKQQMSAFQAPFSMGVKPTRRRQVCAHRPLSAENKHLKDQGGTTLAKIKKHVNRGSNGLRRSVSVSAITATTMVAYPARATGLAFKHPLAAAVSMLCDVFEAFLGGLPHAAWHEVLGMLFHIIASLLTAAP